ncbi:hypothetical protein CISIN_1g041314mg, partial [Citrus sinensis]
CFAHQLQLARISVAKKHEDVNSLFSLVTMLVNVVGASLKHCDILQEKHAQAVIKAFNDGRSQCKAQNITNLHRFRVELFYEILDMQLKKLSNRFNETNTELFLCVTCLCPNDSFAALYRQKLLRLAEFYPNDFSPVDLVVLKTQLDIYIMDVGANNKFSRLKGIDELARKLVD